MKKAEMVARVKQILDRDGFVNFENLREAFPNATKSALQNYILDAAREFHLVNKAENPHNESLYKCEFPDSAKDLARRSWK